jgi:hypothetical protein
MTEKTKPLSFRSSHKKSPAEGMSNKIFSIQTLGDQKQKDKDHVQVILSVSNPCDLETLNIVTSQEHALERMDVIARILQTGPLDQRLSFDFAIEDLTAEKLKRVFRLLDVYFWNRSVFSNIRAKDIKIFFEIFPFGENPAHPQPCQKTVAMFNRENQIREIHFMVNTHRYKESAKYRITNGIKVKNKLQALLISCLHELIHGIIYTYCGQHVGHGDTFLALNSKLHGADPLIYEYKDELER